MIAPATDVLAPLPVAVPLLVGALLLLVGKVLPGRVPDALAIVAALAVVAIDARLAAHTTRGPLVYWMGHWQPHGEVTLGIGLVIDEAEAILAAFMALLFAASFIFAWGYFEDIRAFFHVLMLIFLAAMQGFCLTHDLFNLFVWFEVMSVTAFALTAYRLEADPLEGALNFTVTNTIGSFLILGGIALAYSLAGLLDFGALARSLAQHADDPVAVGAFCMIAAGLLIKGAAIPFHFWLADAHAVAPSPVSVIFSGAMVPLALFGLGKVYWDVFETVPPVQLLMRTLILGLGVTTAIVGGVACLRQRHLKRLLAFSTISHGGILLIGLALPGPVSLAGVLAYFIGHGLVKGALFMVAGILLATAGGIDELWLRGRGRASWPAGVAMAVAGLLLGGAPLGLMDSGSRLIGAAAAMRGEDWILIAVVLGTACTGGAVLRGAGRIFLGLGEIAGEEARGPSEVESEKPDRPLWLMMLPVTVLLLIAIGAGLFHADETILGAAARFLAWDRIASIEPVGPATAAAVPASSHPFVPWLTLGLAIFIAAHELGHAWLPRSWSRASRRVLSGPVFTAIDRTHDGAVGDYVVWILIGLALFSVSSAAALHAG
ncbi:MAG TPA: proton-conducting transporter membrane subunit [Steroidobacteraceae bacterium]|nr:proton-conducting transporter membrane subunit [Steroidobacteraceae bacterium]